MIARFTRDRDFGASHANSFRQPEAPALQD
jgi:hypothetical protein